MGSEFALLLVIVGTNTALYYANAKFSYRILDRFGPIFSLFERAIYISNILMFMEHMKYIRTCNLYFKHTNVYGTYEVSYAFLIYLEYSH